MKKLLLTVAALVLASMGTHAFAGASTQGAPLYPMSDMFVKNAVSVSSFQVVDASDGSCGLDSIDATIAGWGGFPASVKVTRSVHPVLHSFAVGYAAGGMPLMVVYIDDQGVALVALDADIVDMYAKKARSFMGQVSALVARN
jgi:hypothetical protein